MFADFCVYFLKFPKQIRFRSHRESPGAQAEAAADVRQTAAEADVRQTVFVRAGKPGVPVRGERANFTRLVLAGGGGRPAVSMPNFESKYSLEVAICSKRRLRKGTLGETEK